MTAAAAKLVLDVAADLPLGVEVVTKRFGLLGMSESGKTNGIARLGEQLLKIGAQVIAIDTLGNLSGWRSSADGESAGMAIAIFGGEHQDVPLKATAGAALAREIVRAQASAIVDVSELDDEDAYGFVADFMNELYRYNRSPLHLLIDEAHTWAPEHPQSKAHFRCRSAVIRIRKLGRNRGIGSTIASQSSAEVAKAALGQTDVMFALRTAAPTDAAPILAWAKGHVDAAKLAEIRRTLGGLRIGEAWAISPGFLRVTKRVRFRLRETFDSSKTPSFGEVVRIPRTFADVDLARITAAMEADAAGEITPVVEPRSPAMVRTIEVPVIGAAELQELRALIERAAAAGETFLATQSAVATALGGITQAIARIAPSGSTAPAGPAPAPPPPTPPPPPPPPPAAIPGLKAGAVRILEMMARAGRPLTRREAGTLAYVGLGGTISEYVTTLVGRELITEGGGVLALTDAGKAAVAYAAGEKLPTAAAIVDAQREAANLKGGMVRIATLLIDVYPKSLKRPVLAAQAHISAGGTISEYVTKLKGRGLIEETKEGVRASAVLFIAKERKHRA